MEINSLVALAGNALVTAAVTDAWDTTRRRFAHLFEHGKPNLAIERRLDLTRDQLIKASAMDMEQVKTEVAAEWGVRLKDLLADDPDAEAGLLAVIEEVRALLPASAVTSSGYSLAAGGDINVNASGGSVAAGVIHGSVAPPGPTCPGPASR